METQQNIATIATGMLALLISIGISRFGYGPVIADLVDSNGFSKLDAGLIAGANLSGYLLGCLYMSSVDASRYGIGSLRAYVLVSLVTVIALGLSSSFYGWFAVRLINGFAGGATFILVSVYLLGIMKSRDKLNIATIMYTGVGMGILLSSFSVLKPDFAVDTIILIQAAICGVCYVLLLIVSSNVGQPERMTGHKFSMLRNVDRLIALVTLSYLFEGMGYIIYATFIFPYLQLSLPVPGLPVSNWLILGTGAALGPLLVAIAVSMLSIVDVIIILFIVQMLSILLALLVNQTLVIYLSAFGFGVSFMGLTSAFIVYVKYKWHEIVALAGFITIAYSIGQAIGPVLGGLANEIYGGYKYSIMLSMMFVMLSLILLAFVAALERKGDKYALRKY
jgi:predicted MFS family arabinose efflux permease